MRYEYARESSASSAIAFAGCGRSRGLSQERLAELAGLDRNYIGQIERAERNVALVNIVRIAKALEIELGELFVPFRVGRASRQR